jgi:hypothetical protein
MTPFPVDTAVVPNVSGVLGTNNARAPVKPNKAFIVSPMRTPISERKDAYVDKTP